MSIVVNYIRQFGRFQRNARLYLVSNALSGVTIGIILVLYNLYLIALGYGTDFIGLLLFVGTLGGGLAIFPAGLCIDRFGGKAILIGASALMGVAGAGQMVFRSSLPLLISAFIVGVGGAFILVVNAPFLTLNSVSEERPHLFSLNIVLTLITTVLGEALGGALPLWFRHLPWLMASLPPWCHWMLVDQPLARSYQISLLLAGVIAVPSFIPLFMMSDKRLEGSSHPRRAIEEGNGLQRLSARIAHWRTLSWRELLTSALVVLTLVQILIGFGAGLFIPYFNVYFVQHLGASSALFGVIDGLANTLNALLILLAPWCVLRFGKLATLLIPRLLSIPVMLLIGLTSFLPLAAVLYPVRQGLMDMSSGILQLFSMEAVEERHRGLANSSYQAGFQVANAIASSIGGVIIARMGFTPVFVVAAVLYCIALALLWGRFRGRSVGRGKGRDSQELAKTDSQVEAVIVPNIHI